MKIEESLNILFNELEEKRVNLLDEIKWYSGKAIEYNKELIIIGERISALNEIKRLCQFRLLK